MNRYSPFTGATEHAVPRPNGGAGAPISLNLITADASKASPREFLEALGLSSAEQREARRQRDRELCIRLIETGGSLKGFPPVLVAECRQIIAERGCGTLLPPAGWNRVEL